MVIRIRGKKLTAYFSRCKKNRHALTLLKRNFETQKPNEVWVGDITYVWTAEGWLYLAVVLGLFSRKVVGWAVSSGIKKDLVIETPAKE